MSHSIFYPDQPELSAIAERLRFHEGGKELDVEYLRRLDEIPTTAVSIPSSYVEKHPWRGRWYSVRFAPYGLRSPQFLLADGSVIVARICQDGRSYFGWDQRTKTWGPIPDVIGWRLIEEQGMKAM